MKVASSPTLVATLVFGCMAIGCLAFAPSAPAQPPDKQYTDTAIGESPDARSVASDQEVGQARRAYRAQCNRYQSAAFCECLTAGVAQVLAPSDLRLAARTIRERINAQGDAPGQADTDPSFGEGTAMSRIEQAESHYGDACSQFRR